MSSTTLTQSTKPAFDESRMNAFLDRALNDFAAGYGGVMISLGHRL